MPGPLTVGIIGQTMRGDYCRAYFGGAAPTPAIILTDDPGAFADWEMPPGVEVRAIDDDSLGLREKLRRRLRRRLIGWLRGGSALGARAEGAIRRVRPPRVEVSEPVGADAPIRLGLVAQLSSLHEVTAIGEIVVFDVFDLPSVVEFADRTGVPVLVR